FDVLAKAALFRLRGQIDTLASDIIFPPVVRAAQPTFLVLAKPQRNAAVGAELVDQADTSFAVAEADQAFTHQLDADRQTIGLGDFQRQEERRPIASKQLAHERSGSDAAKLIVLFTRHHGDVSLLACYYCYSTSRHYRQPCLRRKPTVMPLPRIAIATGDPAGIGPEIALKAALDPGVRRLCRPLLVGDPAVVELHARCANLSPDLRVVDGIADADWSDGTVNLLDVRHGSNTSVKLGTIDAAYGRASLESASRAIKAALAGDVEAVAAAPQTERSIVAAGIAFDGYPSFVARETGTPVNDVYLMICFDQSRIVHAPLLVTVRGA